MGEDEGTKAGHTWVCFFHLRHSLLQMQSQNRRTGLRPTRCQKSKNYIAIQINFQKDPLIKKFQKDPVAVDIKPGNLRPSQK
jgi:hypothetical protein